MRDQNSALQLMFLGSGNAFGAEGRAFSSFLLNGRYLFDCGPTLMQQMRKGRIETQDIDLVFISHFHADHFFGLPFFFLDAWRNGREKALTIVGPPGIERHTEKLLEIGYSMLPGNIKFPVVYIEAQDGLEAEAAGLQFTAATVIHVPELECFAYRGQIDGRSVAYSGDSTLCDGLLRVVTGADVVVLECSCGHEPVHISPSDVDEVRRHMRADASLIVTHLDGRDKPGDFANAIVATDLGRYCL